MMMMNSQDPLPTGHEDQFGQVQLMAAHGLPQMSSQSALGGVGDVGQRLDTDFAERSLDLSATQKSMLEKQNFLGGDDVTEKEEK